MSNEMELSNAKIPAHLAARMQQPSALADSLSSGIGSGESPNRISIRGSRFRVVIDGNESVLDTTTLGVIIVGANPRLSKVYYQSAWSQEQEATAPDCFSLDGIKPHNSVDDPQNPVCATCKWNQWGSKISPDGKKVKACADQKRLAVVAAGDSKGQVFLLQVTPSALKNLSKYSSQLSARGIPPEVVVTNLSFDPDASYPKLTFSFGGFVDEDMQGVVDKLFRSDQVKSVTGEASDDEAEDGPQQEPQPEPKAKAKPEPKPEPEPEPEPEPKSDQVTTPFGNGTVDSSNESEDAESEPAPKKKAATKKAATKKKATKKAEPKATTSDELSNEIEDLIASMDFEDEE